MTGGEDHPGCVRRRTLLRATALSALVTVLFAGGLVTGCGAGSGDAVSTRPAVTATLPGTVTRPLTSPA